MMIGGMQLFRLLLAVTILWTPASLAAVQSGVPEYDLPSQELIFLGRKLFLDRRLSANGTLSCAMCHVPEQGFAQNQLATPVGINGRAVKRNSPTLLNVRFRTVLFHDGREFTLEDQVWSPLLSRREMGNVSIGAVLARLRSLDDYQQVFSRIFATGITAANIGIALAAYERTLVAANSPFDRWYFDHQADAMTQSAQKGFTLFLRHGCANCHTLGQRVAQFTDDKFHNTGIGFARSMEAPVRGTRIVALSETVSIETTQSFESESLNDLGRYEFTNVPQDRWKYRTPTLRNVALTAPYMHDGSLSTLDQVIRFYMRAGIANNDLDERMLPFSLSESEISSLLDFLNSLTSSHIDSLTRDARSIAVGDTVSPDNDPSTPHQEKRTSGPFSR